MFIPDKIIKQWQEERNAAVLSLDVNTFRAFYKKYQDLGIYQEPLLATDQILEIGLRQMVLGLKNATPEQIADAKSWLLQRGFSTEPWKN